MSNQHLYASANGINSIINVGLSTSHGSSFAVATIECESYTVDIGNTIELYLGYTGDYGKCFTGIVKALSGKTPENTYVVTAQDNMCRPIEYFIASDSQDDPLTYSNIDAEDLVYNLMNLAGITSFIYDATSFTFGVINPVEINLVSSFDFSRQVGDLLAWHLFADEDGAVNFVDRKPYIMDGSTLSGNTDTSGVATLNDNNSIQSNHEINEHDLRNRVVVYGADSISAVASAYSSHLPPDFYKTVAVASPIIDRQSLADDAADYNLDLLNRLTEKCYVTALGDWRVIARKVVEYGSGLLGISSDLWYVYSADHKWSSDGYLTTVELRK